MCFVFSAFVSGCNPVKTVERKLDSMEKELKNKPAEIGRDLVLTFTNMANENEQYLECNEFAKSYARAQKEYRAVYGAYTEDTGALHGNNPGRQIFVQESVRRGMDGVCYIIEDKAAETDFRMLFETDKKRLAHNLRSRIEGNNLAPGERESLRRRIVQLEHAEPCHIVATDRGVRSRGQCGFETDETRKSEQQ